MTTKEAAAEFGGIDKLAEALGITRHAIYLWRGTVPELRQYQIREILRKRGAVQTKEQGA
jgi:hypothetical protein